jgi:hypothetical protein
LCCCWVGCDIEWDFHNEYSPCTNNLSKLYSYVFLCFGLSKCFSVETCFDFVCRLKCLVSLNEPIQF